MHGTSNTVNQRTKRRLNDLDVCEVWQCRLFQQHPGVGGRAFGGCGAVCQQLAGLEEVFMAILTTRNLALGLRFTALNNACFRFRATR
jgi:hypothetical protein